jgi:hypothetical protein
MTISLATATVRTDRECSRDSRKILAKWSTASWDCISRCSPIKEIVYITSHGLATTSIASAKIIRSCIGCNSHRKLRSQGCPFYACCSIASCNQWIYIQVLKPSLLRMIRKIHQIKLGQC